MHRNLLRLLTACLLLVGNVVMAADSWPQWRGPSADGVSTGTPSTEWSAEKNIAWKVDVPGRGSSTPIIWGDKLFLLTAIETDQPAAEEASEATEAEEEQPRPERSEGDRPRRPRGEGGRPPGAGPGGPGGFGRGGGRGGFGRREAPSKLHQFVVICLDRNTGKTLWQQVAAEAVPHEAGHATNTLASASPVTDGKRLYVSFGSYGIFAYSLDGDLIWKKDLGKMQTRAAFGEGASPVLADDALVVNWDHEGDSFITALDAATGDTLWKKERDEPTSWNTPLVTELDGRKQVIVNGANRSRSYDLKTGDVIWECGGQATNAIPSPIRHDNLVYCMTGYRGYALYAIPLNSTGDITDTDKVAWSRENGTPYIASPILCDGLLFITKGRNAVLSCVDPNTGETYFENERLDGLDTLYASPVAAGGNLYFFARNGAAMVVKCGKTFEIVAENKLDDEFDASPAIIGDTMYLRGEKTLYCIEAK
ncbi:outer membrane protein assembly factor BamB family protein [Blastopirellula retiformator]|uniref:Outer membrane biogenesis protein BamB n=1 Tax=Blastopirellula retiformator TaxID=2527970 RepID=A0A5C5V012_9BACT|nr:PQQ-binding-like beta-propeller repeat protein [Blastopirellula retiformator]TWT31976.1 outer membrane biogenesis protein BamB [Blastopirellula retiformator]